MFMLACFLAGVLTVIQLLFSIYASCFLSPLWGYIELARLAQHKQDSTEQGLVASPQCISPFRTDIL